MFPNKVYLPTYRESNNFSICKGPACLCIRPHILDIIQIQKNQEIILKKPPKLQHNFGGFGGEGGNRTLAPVSRPTPLAGEPRHRLGTSPLFIKIWVELAEREGFEPPAPCGVTGFQDQLHKPLGHLSAWNQIHERRLFYHNCHGLSTMKLKNSGNFMRRCFSKISENCPKRLNGLRITITSHRDLWNYWRLLRRPSDNHRMSRLHKRLK